MLTKENDEGKMTKEVIDLVKDMLAAHDEFLANLKALIVAKVIFYNIN